MHRRFKAVHRRVESVRKQWIWTFGSYKSQIKHIGIGGMKAKQVGAGVMKAKQVQNVGFWEQFRHKGLARIKRYVYSLSCVFSK